MDSVSMEMLNHDTTSWATSGILQIILDEFGLLGELLLQRFDFLQSELGLGFTMNCLHNVIHVYRFPLQV